MAMSESPSSSHQRPIVDPPPAAAVDDSSKSEKKPVKRESQIEPTRLAMALPPSRHHEDDDPRKCTYRDFSRVAPPKPTPRSNHSKDPTFPMKLHMMLSTPEFSQIITWLPHGRSWRILKQAEFEEQIIPRFFRHGRYSSFARQVNGWGFRRITQGDDWNSYYHELFLRGMPHLCQRMKRLTSKDDGARRKAQEERIPDLEAMSLVNPVPDGPMGSAAAVPRGLLPGRNPNMMGNGMDASFLARAQMQMQMMNQPPSAYLLQQLQNNQNPRMAYPPQVMQPPPGFLQQFAPGQPPPNNLDAMRQLLARSTNIEDLNTLAAMMGNNNNNQAGQQQQQQGMPPNPYGNNFSNLR